MFETRPQQRLNFVFSRKHFDKYGFDEDDEFTPYPDKYMAIDSLGNNMPTIDFYEFDTVSLFTRLLLDDWGVVCAA